MTARARIRLLPREVDLLLERIERHEYPPRPTVRVIRSASPIPAVPARLDPRAGRRPARVTRRIRRSPAVADLRRLVHASMSDRTLLLLGAGVLGAVLTAVLQGVAR